MPVAAVDEHHHAGAGEQQVCRPTQVALRSRVDPVSQSRGMYQAAHRQFRLRVTTSIALHGLPGAAALEAHGVYMVRGYVHCGGSKSHASDPDTGGRDGCVSALKDDSHGYIQP